MKLAQIQMRVRPGKAENLRHAEALLASVKGADMAVLPEMFCCPYDNGCFRAYGEAAGGAAYQMLSRAAAENHLHAKDPGSFQGTPGFFLSFCCKMSALSWPNAENAETA